jgi:hypothetical protein
MVAADVHAWPAKCDRVAGRRAGGRAECHRVAVRDREHYFVVLTEDGDFE